MSDGLSKKQIDVLKRMGRISFAGDQDFSRFVPKSDDTVITEYVFNPGNSVVIVPDLDLTVGPKELVYLPRGVRDYSVERVNNSQNLRDAVVTLEVLRPVKDVEDLTAKDMEKSETFEEKFGEGEFPSSMLPGDKEGENPFIEGLYDLQDKEDAVNAKEAARAGGGFKRPAGSSKAKKKGRKAK